MAHLEDILFDDASNRVSQLYESITTQDPDQIAHDADGTVHKTWSIKDPDILEEIIKFMEDNFKTKFNYYAKYNKII